MKSIFALFFATNFYCSFFAQTLTISTSGQTGTSGTNWYVSGSNPVRIIGTQTANVNTSVVQGYINAGVDVLLFSVGEISIQNDLTKTNSGRLILRPSNNTVSGAGKITLGNNAQLLLSNGATISNNIELTSGTSTISFAQVEIEYLIVGGGASGGVGRGGGGGAGGVLTGSLDATSTSYNITVGTGGAAVNNDKRGNNGGNSTAFGLTAFGGGAGGGWLSGSEPGLSGGSGGGASASPFVAGNGTSGQGNNGFWLNFYREEGGGGGGAGNAANNQNGGNGISSSISGTQLWYGGGGGAGALSSGWQPAGVGGNGGGGNGTKIGNGTAASGAPNTGGGGGGSEGFYGWSGAGGSGVVILRYLGADVSSGGIEYVGSNAAIGYVVHQFNGGTSALTISQGAFSGTLSGIISGTGNLILNPLNGTLSLTANNTFSGTTTISSGNIQVGNNSTTGTLGTGNIINNSTITFLRSTTISIPGVISGTGALVQQGTGNLILTQNNTYAGTTTISAGSIQLGNGSTTGTVGSGSITNNGALSINRSDVYFFNNTMSGNGSMTKEGSGRVNILAANSYTGGTTLSNGTLAIYHATALGSGSVTLAANSTLLSGRSVTSFSNPIVLTGNATIALDNELEFLLVGGGGGASSGGGGGGGVVHQTTTVTAGNTYTVTVGAGGQGKAPAASNGTNGDNGASTIFNGVTALGGGGGGRAMTGGVSGASGGGAGADSNQAGGTATQGYPGGAGVSTTPASSASGGGGAAAAGSIGWTSSAYNTFYNLGSGQNTMGGNGGSGIANSINGTTTFYGGGGGGGCNNNNGTQPTSRAGQGGQGGGGIGAHGDGISGTAGTPNTGGGGGGGDWEATNGGNGGSGIAIIRYIGATSGTGGTITSGTGTAAGYTIHSFTTVGNNTLTLNTSALNLTGVMSGTGNVTFNATNGSITLSAANTYTGNTALTNGSLVVNTTGSLNAGTYSGSIANAGVLRFRSSTNHVLSGILSGAGELIKETSTSVLTLTANNTYTGTTTISSGTLTIGNNTTTGTFGTGAVINNSAISINRSNDLTITNSISGSGTLSKEALNTLTLTQNNTYAGNNTINAGTLVLQNDAPNPTNKIFNGTGQLRIEPSGTSFAATFSTSSWTFNTTLTGLTLGKTNNAANITIGAAAAINGPITLYGGALTLSAELSSTNNTTGDISLNGSTLSGGSLSVAEGRTLTMNMSATTTYAGAISGSNLSFVKDGSGSLTLPTPTSLTFTNFTINSGTFGVNSNQQLTVTGTLTNNGIFTLESGATFKQGTSVTGTGTYNIKQTIDNGAGSGATLSGRFWYVGSPLSCTRSSAFGTSGSLNKVWEFTNGAYANVGDATTLDPTKGYVHRRSDASQTLTFSGQNLYAQDATLSLSNNAGTYGGWHLVSNPYTAYLNWAQVIGSNLTSNMSNTYYIRSYNSNNQDVDALISYNAANGLESNTSSFGLGNTGATTAQYIAPLQAFWVKVPPTAPLSSTAGALRLERAFTSHQTGTLKNTGVYPVLAKVNLYNGAKYDQALVYMNEFMTNAFDQNDSEKMFVSGVASVYTMASGKKLVMNGLKNNKKKISVPLYLELPTSKVYQLQLSDYIMEDGLILLEDKQEGTIQDFTIHDTYSFYANSGVLQNRFVLHFYMPDAGVSAQGPSNSWVEEESAINEGGSILVSSNGRGKVTITQDIDATPSEKGSVVVRDAAGREIYNGQLTGSATNLELDAPSGIYFVSVELNGQVEVKKIFVQQ